MATNDRRTTLLSDMPASGSAATNATQLPSDATCTQLTSLALRIASSSQSSLAYLSELGALAETDEQFGEMVREASFPPFGQPLPDATFSHWHDDSGARILEFLCGLKPTDASSWAQRNLLQTAHLCLRIQTLDTRLEETSRSKNLDQLYNFAYGLSHELNNPLANISTRASMLASQEDVQFKRDLLESIVENAMRGKELLGDLMLIARPPIHDLQRLELAALIRNVRTHAQKWCTQFGVELECKTRGECIIQADEIALREALWCVIRNSIEALPQGGRVHIVSTCSDAQMRIEVRDNGPGLSQDALRHAFDPFFSGREAGRGLGIGLAKCQAIIHGHGGTITISNGPLSGCLVCIELPAACGTSH